MHPDPIVDETRSLREAYAQQFGFDLKAIQADLKAREQTSEHRLVKLPARRVTATVTAHRVPIAG